MSGLRGDTSKLSKLASAMKALPVRVSQAVAARVAPELTSRARASFAAQENPYGDTWAPGVDGNAVTLRKSGTLFSGVRFTAIGTRVRAVLGAPYAKYQVGKRKVLPSGGSKMPSDWSAAIEDIVQQEVSKDLERSA